jgi:hypothetical protein
MFGNLVVSAEMPHEAVKAGAVNTRQQVVRPSFLSFFFSSF